MIYSMCECVITFEFSAKAKSGGVYILKILWKETKAERGSKMERGRRDREKREKERERGERKERDSVWVFTCVCVYMYAKVYEMYAMYAKQC